MREPEAGLPGASVFVAEVPSERPGERGQRQRSPNMRRTDTPAVARAFEMSASASERNGDVTAKWRRRKRIRAPQLMPKPALKHARTELQSGSESRPIKRTSRCKSVTGNNLKNDG